MFHMYSFQGKGGWLRPRAGSCGLFALIVHRLFDLVAKLLWAVRAESPVLSLRAPSQPMKHPNLNL